MRVLVCGGRDYNDWDFLKKTMDDLHSTLSFKELIEGGANGADKMANKWATLNKITTLTYDAMWENYGKQAGIRRNYRMLNEGRPQLVVAFPGNVGTHHMVTISEAAKVKVIKAGWKKNEVL